MRYSDVHHDGKMLSKSEIDSFIEKGFIKLDGAFPPAEPICLNRQDEMHSPEIAIRNGLGMGRSAV